jgi:hypothetical protein
MLQTQVEQLLHKHVASLSHAHAADNTLKYVWLLALATLQTLLPADPHTHPRPPLRVTHQHDPAPVALRRLLNVAALYGRVATATALCQPSAMETKRCSVAHSNFCLCT